MPFFKCKRTAPVTLKLTFHHPLPHLYQTQDNDFTAPLFADSDYTNFFLRFQIPMYVPLRAGGMSENWGGGQSGNVVSIVE